MTTHGRIFAWNAVSRGTAHTGYQLRRVLDLQAKAVRKAVRERTHSGLD